MIAFCVFLLRLLWLELVARRAVLALERVLVQNLTVQARVGQLGLEGLAVLDGSDASGRAGEDKVARLNPLASARRMYGHQSARNSPRDA